MKKSRIILGVIALAIVAAMIVACTKEKEKENRVAQDNGELTTVSKEDDMRSYLKQFKEKMRSATKGDETLSLEDARWHLEAVLNYTYGDAGHKSSEIQCNTFRCKLKTSNGGVQLADLNQAFNLVSKNVEQTFSNCKLPNKSILGIQTELINEREGDSVTIQSTISTRGISIPVNYYVDSTDYWYEDSISGKCGPYQGSCLGTGAVQIIRNKIILNRPLIACPGNGVLYFTDFTSIYFSNTDVLTMPDPNSPHGYRIPYISYPSYLPLMCFSPEDINYYVVEGLKLINEFAPIDKVFYNMTNTYMEAVPIGYHLAYHEYKFTYAKPNCGGSDV